MIFEKKVWAAERSQTKSKLPHDTEKALSSKKNNSSASKYADIEITNLDVTRKDSPQQSFFRNNNHRGTSRKLNTFHTFTSNQPRRSSQQNSIFQDARPHTSHQSFSHTPHQPQNLSNYVNNVDQIKLALSTMPHKGGSRSPQRSRNTA